MSIASIILTALNWIVYILGFISVIGFMFVIPAGIIFLVLYFSEKDELKKKSWKKKGIWIVASPFILIFGALIIGVIVRVIANLYTNTGANTVL